MGAADSENQSESGKGRELIKVGKNILIDGSARATWRDWEIRPCPHYTMFKERQNDVNSSRICAPPTTHGADGSQCGHGGTDKPCEVTVIQISNNWWMTPLNQQITDGHEKGLKNGERQMSWVKNGIYGSGCYKVLFHRVVFIWGEKHDGIMRRMESAWQNQRKAMEWSTDPESVKRGNMLWFLHIKRSLRI